MDIIFFLGSGIVVIVACSISSCSGGWKRRGYFFRLCIYVSPLSCPCLTLVIQSGWNLCFNFFLSHADSGSCVSCVLYHVIEKIIDITKKKNPSLFVFKTSRPVSFTALHIHTLLATLFPWTIWCLTHCDGSEL